MRTPHPDDYRDRPPDMSGWWMLLLVALLCTAAVLVGVLGSNL